MEDNQVIIGEKMEKCLNQGMLVLWIVFLLPAACSTKFTQDEDFDEESTDGVEGERGDVSGDTGDVDTSDADGDLPEENGADPAPDDGGEMPDGARPCGTPGDCTDDNPCTIDICSVEGFCNYAWEDNGTDCTDGSFCNGEDTCLSGHCVSAGNPCEVPEDCDEDHDWCSCDDGYPCTVDDHYVEASCVGTTASDNLPCGSCGNTIGCFICCGGTCVNASHDSECYECGNNCNTGGGEHCCYTAAHECGHYWCCCGG